MGKDKWVWLLQEVWLRKTKTFFPLSFPVFVYQNRFCHNSEQFKGFSTLYCLQLVAAKKMLQNALCPLFTFLSYWWWWNVLGFFYSRILIFSCMGIFSVPETTAEQSTELMCYDRQNQPTIISDMQNIILDTCIMRFMENCTP